MKLFSLIFTFSFTLLTLVNQESTKAPIIPLKIDFYFLSFPQLWPGASCGSYQIMVAA